MPNLTKDAIVTSSAIIMSLQTLVSRKISPLESGVCSITKIEGGDAFNVIPDTVVMRGTVRALTIESLHVLRDSVEEVSKTIAAAHGCDISIRYSTDFYPPTINDDALWRIASKSSEILTGGQTVEVEPTMGAEDFSFIANEIPSAFMLLGQGSNISPKSSYGLHHPCFGLDESILSQG